MSTKSYEALTADGQVWMILGMIEPLNCAPGYFVQGQTKLGHIWQINTMQIVAFREVRLA